MRHRSIASATCSLFLSLPLLAPSAHAGDWWVDVVHGDDANGGTSEFDAWRTITHALVQLGPLPGIELDVVHVMPGEYREINGEVFPLELRDRLRLSGVGGAEATLLVGGLRVGVGDEPTRSGTGAEGFTIRAKPGQDRGIQIRSPLPTRPVRQATFRDLRIEGFPTGVFIYVKGSASAGSSLILEDTQISSIARPVAASVLKQARFDLTLRRVTIQDSGTVILNATNNGELNFLFDRSSIRIGQGIYNGLIGSGSASGGLMRTTFRDSEITGLGIATALGLDGDVLIERCTITGYETGVTLMAPVVATLRDSIIWGNITDLRFSPGSAPTVTDCVIDHPAFTGSNGNFSAPPLFVDPATGDYRLLFGSPVADLLPATREVDLGGTPRFVDGDLDVRAGRDIGARELRLLEGPARAGLGETVTFEVQGPSGAVAWLFLSREAPLRAPLVTGLGLQWLAPGTFAVVARAVIGGPRQTAIDIVLPSDPSLAGTTLGLQALLYSSSAPLGAAWSEPVTLELE